MRHEIIGLTTMDRALLDETRRSVRRMIEALPERLRWDAAEVLALEMLAVAHGIGMDDAEEP